MWWKSVFAGCFLLASLSGNTVSAVQYAYQVSFTDKNNTPYSLGSPLSYLSTRAMARRTAQGILVDSTDIPVNANYIDSVLTLTGSKLHGVSRWLNSCVVLLSDSANIHALDGKPYIASTRFVAYYPGTLHNKPKYNTFRTTALDATYYGNTWQQTSMVNGQTLHENGHLGAGKLIAVIDAGFISTDTHPALNNMRASGRLIDWYNFTLDTTYIYNYDTHGTKALSTMAGDVPGTYVGSAPAASYALYISEDNTSEQPIELLNLVSATERADSLGADIITSSLGYNTFDNPAFNFNFAVDFDGKSTVVAKAANIATQKGMLFVASAGNEGGNAWNKILTPGDADSALTIGSVDAGGTNAASSGYGPNAAGQIKPDVCAMGQPASIFSGSTYSTENGTSFATPQIAGWAACLWHSKPSATPYQIRQAIIKCASRYTSPGPQIGYGIPDFYCTQILLGIPTASPKDAAGLISALPNPFNDEIAIWSTSATGQRVDLQLVDVTGKIIFAQSVETPSSNVPVLLSTPNLASGVYILRAVSATQQQVIKLEKL